MFLGLCHLVFIYFEFFFFWRCHTPIFPTLASTFTQGRRNTWSAFKCLTMTIFTPVSRDEFHTDWKTPALTCLFEKRIQRCSPWQTRVCQAAEPVLQTAMIATPIPLSFASRFLGVLAEDSEKTSKATPRNAGTLSLIQMVSCCRQAGSWLRVLRK